MLCFEEFKTVVKNTPLVSIDFIIVNEENKILLGRRVNKPAMNFLFTLGGRVYKDEKLEDAKKRVLKDETNLNLEDFNPLFLGTFEHFYKESFVDENISTHYVNLAYEIKVSHMQDLPKKQHNNYVWLSLEELLNSNEVHNYVKDYFKK